MSPREERIATRIRLRILLEVPNCGSGWPMDAMVLDCSSRGLAFNSLSAVRRGS